MSVLKIKGGVVTGNRLVDLLQYCKESECALPAVNVIGSSSINAVLQAAKEASSPVIIQFSNGGAHFNAGKFLDNDKQRAAVAGATVGALHIHHLSKLYGVPVVLHTDHCARKLIPWVEGLIAVNEQYYKENKCPLFSTHMLDLSEESLEDNLRTCSQFLERLAKVEIGLEIELGVTGGEEDGVDNTGIDSSRLYTQPEEVLAAYDALVGKGLFTVAASFGNTHGVYKPGNVKLTPKILHNSQQLVQRERNTGDKPLFLVFHGGSGSRPEEIREGVSYGVIKFNIDTDTQWAFTKPIKEYMDKNDGYLHSQIGNPDGDDKPNKKWIDPRGWMHSGENGIIARLQQAFKDLQTAGKFILEE